MDNQIDFTSDIKQYGNIITKKIIINNNDININIIEYNDNNIINTINNWNTCLGMLGKSELFKTKEIMKVIYCLLTDCCIINDVNITKIGLDIFDKIFDRFLRIDVISDKRYIKLKIFTVCNTLIVFDCKDLKNYKIYEIFNIKQIKEYYGTSKINFDTLIHDMKIEPKIEGNFNNLINDFKKYSINNYNHNEQKIINKLEKFMAYYKKMEKNVQKEYKNFYLSHKNIK